ncbi:hypothetical protein CASbig_68 [Mycobacterium phage CASbig]|uniref:hypothetical protein n=1 Tax=Mycobacterium phage CASbig TaxID=1327035 RepID=UPI00032B837C|nr:hypothetical protein JMN56_gp68 [Mycobacterium phage CASbig]AGK88110.1 hypothetical protein CASbig_68 [Mycobacterium phage CASbig]
MPVERQRERTRGRFPDQLDQLDLVDLRRLHLDVGGADRIQPHQRALKVGVGGVERDTDRGLRAQRQRERAAQSATLEANRLDLVRRPAERHLDVVGGDTRQRDQRSADLVRGRVVSDRLGPLISVPDLERAAGRAAVDVDLLDFLDAQTTDLPGHPDTPGAERRVFVLVEIELVVRNGPQRGRGLRSAEPRQPRDVRFGRLLRRPGQRPLRPDDVIRRVRVRDRDLDVLDRKLRLRPRPRQRVRVERRVLLDLDRVDDIVLVPERVARDDDHLRNVDLPTARVGDHVSRRGLEQPHLQVAVPGLSGGDVELRVALERPRFAPRRIPAQPGLVVLVVEDLDAEHQVASQDAVVQVPSAGEVPRLLVRRLHRRVEQTRHLGSEVDPLGAVGEVEPLTVDTF